MSRTLYYSLIDVQHAVKAACVLREQKELGDMILDGLTGGVWLADSGDGTPRQVSPATPPAETAPVPVREMKPSWYWTMLVGNARHGETWYRIGEVLVDPLLGPAPCRERSADVNFRIGDMSPWERTLRDIALSESDVWVRMRQRNSDFAPTYLTRECCIRHLSDTLFCLTSPKSGASYWDMG